MLGDDLLDGAADIAAYTRIPVRKIYRMAEQGMIPVTKKGGRIYARKSEIDRSFSSSDQAA